MKQGATLTYMVTDHLSGAALMMTSSNPPTEVGEVRYFPFGGQRAQAGTVATDKRYTGQQLEVNQLYHYGARLYNADIGRMLSADTIVPEPGNPQSLNRYSYVLNNPLRYTDPSGNKWDDGAGGCTTATCDEELGWDPTTGGAQPTEPMAAAPSHDPGDDYYCSLDPLCARPGVGGQVSFECAAYGRNCYSPEHLEEYPPLPREVAEPSECAKDLWILGAEVGFGVATLFGLEALGASAFVNLLVHGGELAAGGYTFSRVIEYC